MTLELEDIDILPYGACPYKPSMVTGFQSILHKSYSCRLNTMKLYIKLIDSRKLRSVSRRIPNLVP